MGWTPLFGQRGGPSLSGAWMCIGHSWPKRKALCRRLGMIDRRWLPFGRAKCYDARRNHDGMGNSGSLPKISKTQYGTTDVLIAGETGVSFEALESLLRQSEPQCFRIKRVSSYDTAIKAIAKGAYDICFVGETLAGGTGMAIIRKTVASGWSVPIILVTRRGGIDFRLKAIAAGAVDCLKLERLEPKILSRAILNALDNKRALSHLRDERKTKAKRRLLDTRAATEHSRKPGAQHSRGGSGMSSKVGAAAQGNHSPNGNLAWGDLVDISPWAKRNSGGPKPRERIRRRRPVGPANAASTKDGHTGNPWVELSQPKKDRAAAKKHKK